jgi:hypothetical protein
MCIDCRVAAADVYVSTMTAAAWPADSFDRAIAEFTAGIDHADLGSGVTPADAVRGWLRSATNSALPAWDQTYTGGGLLRRSSLIRGWIFPETGPLYTTGNPENGYEKKASSVFIEPTGLVHCGEVSKYGLRPESVEVSKLRFLLAQMAYRLKRHTSEWVVLGDAFRPSGSMPRGWGGAAWTVGSYWSVSPSGWTKVPPQ